MSDHRPARLAAGISWQWIQQRVSTSWKETYYITVIKYHAQDNLQKKELAGTYSFRGITSHHCRKLREVVVGTAESLHLQLQAGSRERKLGMVHGFEAWKPGPSDVFPPARPHLHLPTTNDGPNIQTSESIGWVGHSHSNHHRTVLGSPLTKAPNLRLNLCQTSLSSLNTGVPSRFCCLYNLTQSEGTFKVLFFFF